MACGRDKLLGTKAYWKTSAGTTAAATEWLLDRGITVISIYEFPAQIAKSKATFDHTLFWEAHHVGQRRPFWHMSIT